MTLDQWQAELMRSTAPRVLRLCARQPGKSTVSALIALATAVMRHLRALSDALITAESALCLELANGSRIVSLPGDERTIRGYAGAALIVLDEAARVEDDLIAAVRPMLDALLHKGVLRFAAALQEAGAMAEELKDFRRKVSDAGRATYAARVGRHDDLVLSVAIACWWASRPPPPMAAFGKYGMA